MENKEKINLKKIEAMEKKYSVLTMFKDQIAKSKAEGKIVLLNTEQNACVTIGSACDMEKVLSGHFDVWANENYFRYSFIDISAEVDPDNYVTAIENGSFKINSSMCAYKPVAGLLIADWDKAEPTPGYIVDNFRKYIRKVLKQV